MPQLMAMAAAIANALFTVLNDYLVIIINVFLEFVLAETGTERFVIGKREGSAPV